MEGEKVEILEDSRKFISEGNDKEEFEKIREELVTTSSLYQKIGNYEGRLPSHYSESISNCMLYQSLKLNEEFIIAWKKECSNIIAYELIKENLLDTMMDLEILKVEGSVESRLCKFSNHLLNAKQEESGIELSVDENGDTPQSQTLTSTEVTKSKEIEEAPSIENPADERNTESTIAPSLTERYCNCPEGQLQKEKELIHKLKPLYDPSSDVVEVAVSDDCVVMSFHREDPQNNQGSPSIRSRRDYIEKNSKLNILNRYDQMAIVTTVLKINGVAEPRLFKQYSIMHKYDKNDCIIDTIEVGPILTTLCKDSDVYLLIRRASDDNNVMVLTSLDSCKTYFVDFEQKPDTAVLQQKTHDFYSRHYLYYLPEKLIPRDVKDPAKLDNRKTSQVKLQEKFNYWKVVPGLRPPSVESELDKRTRNTRKRKQPHNVGHDEETSPKIKSTRGKNTNVITSGTKSAKPKDTTKNTTKATPRGKKIVDEKSNEAVLTTTAAKAIFKELLGSDKLKSSKAPKDVPPTPAAVPQESTASRENELKLQYLQGKLDTFKETQEEFNKRRDIEYERKEKEKAVQHGHGMEMGKMYSQFVLEHQRNSISFTQQQVHQSTTSMQMDVHMPTTRDVAAKGTNVTLTEKRKFICNELDMEYDLAMIEEIVPKALDYIKDDHLQLQCKGKAVVIQTNIIYSYLNLTE